MESRKVDIETAKPTSTAQSHRLVSTQDATGDAVTEVNLLLASIQQGGWNPTEHQRILDEIWKVSHGVISFDAHPVTKPVERIESAVKELAWTMVKARMEWELRSLEIETSDTPTLALSELSLS